MPNGYRITGQRGTEDLVNGRFIEVMQVDVVTDDGTSKSFRIPLAQYTVQSVTAIVDDWFERQQAIAAIGNGG